MFFFLLKRPISEACTVLNTSGSCSDGISKDGGKTKMTRIVHQLNWRKLSRDISRWIVLIPTWTIRSRSLAWYVYHNTWLGLIFRAYFCLAYNLKTVMMLNGVKAGLQCNHTGTITTVKY